MSSPVNQQTLSSEARERLEQVEAVTPAYVPLGPEPRQTQGVFSWIVDGAKSIAGGALGMAAHVSMNFFIPDIKPYQDALDKKTKDVGFSAMLHRLSSGLFEFISEKVPGNFLKSIASGSQARGSRLLEALICHALTHVSKESDSPHVIKTAVEAILASTTNFIEKPHRGMKENYERYKTGRSEKEKKESYEFLCQEITPLVDDITKKLGLDEKGLQAFIPYGASYVVGFIRPILIGQILEFYGQTILGAALTTQEKVLLENMKSAEDPVRNTQGAKDLELVSKAVAEKATPWIMKMLTQKCDLLASKVDKVLTRGSLLVADEAILSQEFHAILSEQGAHTEKMVKSCEELIAGFLNKGLVRIACSSPLKEGDVKARLEAYFRQLFSSQKFDPLLAEKIREFQQQNAELIKAEKTLALLRKEVLTKPLPLSKAFETRFDKARDLVDELKRKVNSHTEEEILSCFRPLVKKVLADMRYNGPSALPLPEALQEVIWDEALMGVVPDLLIEQYALLQPAFDDLFQDIQKRPEYVKSLASRGNEELATYARSFARYLKKFIDSFVPLNAANWTLLAAEKLGEMGYIGTEGRKAVQDLFEKKGDLIADWAEERGAEVVDAVDKRAGQLIEDGLEAFIVRIFDALTANIRKMEEKDPAMFFRFTLEMFGGLNKHIELVNRVTREQGKKYMYEVDQLVWLREFERARQLDPAMPGHQLQSEIRNTELNIQALEQQIEERSIELGLANTTLKEEKLKLQALKAQADKLMRDNFYDNFMLYLLSLCGIKGPQDLPGPKQYREEMWQLITKTLGGDILLEAVRSSFEPSTLNKTLLVALEQVNETLTAEAKNELQAMPLTKDDQDMVEAFVKLLDHAKETLPGTWIGNLAKIDELRKLPGPSLAHAMREVMKNYSFEKLFVFAINKASVVVSDMLLDPLPKTRQELVEHKINKVKENERTIQKFHREAGATTGNLWDNLTGRIVAKWNSFQDAFDRKVEGYFGWIGRSVKKGFDYVCRIIFIDVIVRPLYWAVCIPFWVFNHFYSKRVVFHAEHLRRNIVETSIHQNFGFWAMRLMKSHFKAPRV